VVDGITVPHPRSKGWINEVIHALKGVEVRVGPRQLRVSDVLDDEADKLVAEILANVHGEIFDPREHPHPADDPREGENWEERVFPKLKIGDRLIDDSNKPLPCKRTLNVFGVSAKGAIAVEFHASCPPNGLGVGR